VPSSIVSLKALPLTANGKLDVRALPPDDREGDGRHPASALPAPVQRPLEPEPDPRAPANEWEQRLKALWESLLEADDVGCEDNFFELGGHSLLAIRLIDAIDRAFGRTLDIATFFHAPTIRDQALLLREKRALSTCVIAIQSRGTRPPLFIVPGYGGAVSPFHALAKALGPEQPLYLVDLNSVGRDGRQAITVESVAAQVVESMRHVRPRGPYHIAGYSLGGRIAYEIAQQLQRDGESIGLLAMLDCGAPGYPRVQSFVSRTFLHIRHALLLAPLESGAYFAARVKSLGKYMKTERVYPPVFAENVAEKAMRAARAIEAHSQVLYDAWLAYVPRPYAGTLSIVRAAVRSVRLGVVDDDPHLGWGKLVGNRMQLAHMQCGHMEMLEPQNLPTLARLLCGWLGGAQTEARARAEALTV
jgi:thioesterase domain-containing protein/acyl carrier protein